MSRRLGVLLQKAEDEAKALKDEFTSPSSTSFLAAVKHDRDAAGVLRAGASTRRR
jgi:hypothetical protein